METRSPYTPTIKRDAYWHRQCECTLISITSAFLFNILREAAGADQLYSGYIDDDVYAAALSTGGNQHHLAH